MSAFYSLISLLLVFSLRLMCFVGAVWLFQWFNVVEEMTSNRINRFWWMPKTALFNCAAQMNVRFQFHLAILEYSTQQKIQWAWSKENEFIVRSLTNWQVRFHLNATSIANCYLINICFRQLHYVCVRACVFEIKGIFSSCTHARTSTNQ